MYTILYHGEKKSVREREREWRETECAKRGRGLLYVMGHTNLLILKIPGCVNNNRSEKQNKKSEAHTRNPPAEYECLRL